MQGIAVFYDLEITSNHNETEGQREKEVVFYDLEITSNHNPGFDSLLTLKVFYDLEITSNHNLTVSKDLHLPSFL